MLEPRPILFVDDDDEIIAALNRVIQQRKWNARLAQTPTDALAALTREPVAVVISDFVLPECDGIEFLREVRARWPDTERVLMTAADRPDILERALNEARITRFLSKPWRNTTLVAVVEETLEQSRIRRERLVFLDQVRQRNEELSYLNERLKDRLQRTDLEVVGFRRRWDAALDAISDPLLVVGPNYHVEGSNPAACRLAGCSSNKEMEGRHCYEVLFQNTAPCEGCPIEREQGRVTLKRADVSRSYDARAYLLPGKPGYLCIYHDVTQQIEMEQRATQLQKMSLIGRLSASLLHELNNPLQGIMMLGRLALDDADPPSEQAHSLEQLLACALRCRRIVEALRRFVRHPHGSSKSVDLATIADRGRLIFSGTRTHRLVWQVSEQPVWCLADANHLEQVLVNLIQNAIDASPEKSDVLIFVGYDSEVPVIRIDDAGPGVPEAERELIFEPFYSTKAEGVGTGLGLAISRTLVLEHQGMVRVSTSPPGGTRMEVRLRQGAGPTPEDKHDRS